MRTRVLKLAVLAATVGSALACGRPAAPPGPTREAAGPPPTVATAAITSTPAGDVSTGTLLARAVCWLDDAASAATCLPPSQDALAAVVAMGTSGDRHFVAPLIDMRSLDVGWAAEVSEALTALTGQRHATDGAWYGWLAANPQPLPEGYARWKGRLLALIDPTYASVLAGSSASDLRPELVMWAGVRPGELPRLDEPSVVAKDDAGYLEGGDTVYALQLGGVLRAYPSRILAWHPVVHDQVDGIPVVLTYCGPCESASAFVPSVGGRVLRFRDAGLWLHGRPLLVDEQTGTLWDAYSGRAVIGPLAAGGVTLERRALVTSTWEEWSGEHPSTGVLALGTGFARDYSAAAQRARDASMVARFPATAPIDARLSASTRVLGLVAGSEARAFRLEDARARRMETSTVGGERFVLLSLGPGRAVRVYRPATLQIRELRDDFTIVGSDGLPGDRWWMREQAIVSQLDGRTHAGATWVESTWAAWSSAYPHTSISGG